MVVVAVVVLYVHCLPLLAPVSLIPPYDPAFYEDEIVGRYNEIMQHNTIHPVQFMGNDNNHQRRPCGPDNIQDIELHYDREAHIPRPVFISGDYNDPIQ